MNRLALTLAVWGAFAIPAQAIEIEEITTPGGVTAWLVEEPSLPFAAVEIRFRGGKSLDADETLGAVNLMTALLEEGAGDMDARAFAEARDDLAMSLSFDAGDDSVSISAQFLSGDRETAADLVATVLTNPRFDEAAIERVRAQVLSSLRSDAEDPSEIASLAFGRAAYGLDHPYGRPEDGTVETVAALTRDDLLTAHANTIARDRVYVSAVGDISADALSDFIDTVLADLPEAGAPLPERVDIALGGEIEIVEFDTPQAIIRFGQPGIERDDPDFFPAFVMNHILGGGGFGSRLTDEVRVKRGLTYGIYSYLANKDHAALLAGGTSTVNERAGETVTVIRDEWARLASEGATPDELESAQTYLTGAYPLRFDGNSQIARILVGMQMDGLSRDYVETRNGKVEAVTAEDVARVAQRLLLEGGPSFIIVGQPEGVTVGN